MSPRPRFYDTHAHLDFEGIATAAQARAFDAGVRKVLVPGVDPTQWARALALKDGPLDLRFAVGGHPLFGRFAGGDLEAWVDRLDAVAIGEFGWDRGAPFDDVFADAHIELAQVRELPIVLHIVGAHGHALARLGRHGTLRGVVHAYSGSAELVARYVDLGLHVSVGPSVIDERARKVRLATAAIPQERLLIETDAPDQIAEPADVVRVAHAVAEVRGVSVAALAESTYRNAEALFG